jgi:hypothetical protein
LVEALALSCRSQGALVPIHYHRRGVAGRGRGTGTTAILFDRRE